MKKTVVLSFVCVLILSIMLQAEPHQVQAIGETQVAHRLSGVDSALPIDLDQRVTNKGDEPESHIYIPPTAEVIALTHQQIKSFSCTSVTDVPPSECEVLVALYYSTNGAGWTNNNNWLTSPMVGTWYGLTVTNGHVADIDIAANLLNGPLPPELGNLSYLEYLNLKYNDLSGSIPPELGNLINLQSLDLGTNWFTGIIPPELGNLAKLTDLALSSNQLTGTIPPELGNLSDLESLLLYHNQLSGSIPPELGNLSNLLNLELWSNQLTGTIPPDLCNLSNLETLVLYYNFALAGSIPPELGNLRNLQVLDLTYNQHSGSIPPELGNLVNLTDLALDFNQLTGTIPPELGNLSNLYELEINNNQLSGSIPLEFINLGSLSIFDFSENNLCVPANPDFSAWLARILWQGTGISCNSSSYSISGQVTDENGTPLGGVSILCNGKYTDKTVSTGTDGNYTCDDLPPDMYLVEHPNGGLQSEVNLLNLSPSVYGWFFLDRNRTQLNFRVGGFYGTYYGVIKDSETNLPIPNASVKLGGAQPVITGISGEYAISTLGGYYMLTVSAPGYISQKQPVSVIAPFSLEKNISIVPYPTNVYRLPYPAGEYRYCTQGNSSSFSHYGKDKYAFDFGANINSVVAAREGRVMMVKTDGKIVGRTPGCGNKANYVLIKHADGRASLYVHLKSVSVNVRDWVKTGQEIGIAGTTGCSTGVHLHFILEEYAAGRWYTNSVPVSFFDVTENYSWNSTLRHYYVVSPSNGVPITGYYYKSGNNLFPPQSVKSSQQPESTITEDTVAPEGGAAYTFRNTSEYAVLLTAFDYVSDNLQMRVARSVEALEVLPWVPFITEINWEYPTIYVQYRDESGNTSETYSAFVESVGYEQQTLDFVTDPLICTNQDIGLVNQTTPYCEQCSWLWDFGDGQSSNEMEPVLDDMWEYGFAGYAAPGEYLLSVTMNNALGQYSTSKPIEVLESPDNGYFASRLGLTVTVSGADGNALDWIWDFGDGTIEHGRTASHTYNSEDDFPPYISLQVVSENGCHNLNYFGIPDELNVFLPLINR